MEKVQWHSVKLHVVATASRGFPAIAQLSCYSWRLRRPDPLHRRYAVCAPAVVFITSNIVLYCVVVKRGGVRIVSFVSAPRQSTIILPPSMLIVFRLYTLAVIQAGLENCFEKN